ncbi:microcephalin [Tribolium castaneum]|uniref:BRCT domain-containing protein n=1 Tax=Tribolium castaneum TaxID=7070 RepID=D6WI54_TRICA|nr:PREDICTED: microcephalin [Tribolium castaneum]EFA01060.1 hypothetical protein TcasGA2_TC003978 [Tribolium castaneum]|eukprot:XP_015834234.1 PREDICTED: microcephalin [Tribolium castaneum]
MSTTQSDIPSSDIIASLMKDPVKKAQLLQLLVQEKSGFEAYKRQEETKKTPLKNVKRRVHCESPTAVLRRRMLEQKDQDSTSDSSDLSETANEVKGPKLPFGELLKGVRAFVDVNRDGVDKSEGIKAVMKLMGATIREQFTRDVTHVIFKDGSFTTFEKARLMKIHLVSVLWLDAVRRNSARVPEKNYPAFGSRVNDANVSIMCSQLQKDYEDIIKDEKRRTWSSLPKPKQSTEQNRRRTMLPQTQTSMSSYATAQNKPLSDSSDSEVASILNSEQAKSPELTSDDSECGIIDGCSSKRSKDQTDILQSSSFLSESTDSTSLLSRITTRKLRKTSVVSDMDITPNLDERSRRSSSLRVSSETDKTKSGLRDSKSSEINKRRKQGNTSVPSVQSSTMSSLRISSGTDKTKSGLEDSKSSETNKSQKQGSVSSVQSSIMSSLKISSGTDKTKSGLGDSISGKENCSVMLERTSLTDKPEEGRSVGKRRAFKSLEERSNTSSTTDSGKTPKKKKPSGPSPSFTRITKRKSKVESSESDFETKRGKTKKNSSLDSGAESDVESSIRSETSRRSRRSVSVALFTDTPPDRNRAASVSRAQSVRSTSTRNIRSRSKSPSESEAVQNPTPAKKTRKLYNPDDVNVSVFLTPVNEKEQEGHRRLKPQVTPKDLFVNPNNINIRIGPSGKKAPKQQKKIETPPSDDENGSLLDLLNTSERRRSQRLTLSQTKPKYVFTSDESQSTSSLPITPIKRRSTMDFVPISQTQKRKLKLDPKRKTSIVCTKFHSSEVVQFESIVNTLGRFFVEDVVTSRTTHLVAGEAKRTINMLKAIARGCWILKHEWLLKSHEQGTWLNEEDYELTEYSPAVQMCRLQREAFGPSYTMDIFKDCGCIYLGQSTSPKASDLKALITICQGKVTAVLKNASIVVGEYIEGDDLTCVTEVWVLDSIHVNKLKSVKNYLIKAPNETSPAF